MKKKRMPFMALAAGLLLTLVVAVVVLWNDFTLQVQVPGERTVYIEVGESYTLPDGKAFFSGNLFLREPKEVAVRRVGEVNTQKPGTYSVIYVAQKFGKVDSVTCNVIVQDTKAPVITLRSDPSHTTLPGLPYDEEGFTATDAVDGDITHLVERREENGKVTYTVKDAAGNVAEVQREIKYEDKLPPILTLKGDAEVVLSVGQPYEEAGWTAMDNGVFDLSEKVTVSSRDKYYPEGTYTLTYTVTDDYGNAATATRTLKVKPSGNGKVIYLTFDDGPSAYTERLLKILDKYNVKASFFVTDTKYLYLVKDMIAAGHTVGLHTATHIYKDIYSSEEAYFADLHRIREAVYQYTGTYFTMLRFPGGSCNLSSQKYNAGIMTRLTKAVQEKGYRYVDWTVDSGDGMCISSRETVQNAIEGCKKETTCIVLMHDIMRNTVNGVEEFLIWGLENGYTFLPLTENSPVCHLPIRN